jgi:peptidoglycan/LPS O-acetylase OafA/YrhL
VRDEGRRGPTLPRVSALDGARGLAVAGVLLFHAGHLLGGYLGVDFFFTLSGFLITSLLLTESTKRGSVGLGGFWSRRARRLLPALAVMLFGVALYAWLFGDRTALFGIRGDAWATMAYVANWHQIFSHQSYFALFASPSPLTHTWSLAIEEQFYVVWPLVFVALLARFKRATPKAVLVTSLALAAVSSTLMIVLYSASDTDRLYYGTDTRAAAILFGAALAAWLAIKGPTTSRTRRNILEGLAIVSVIGLAIAWTRLDGQSATLYQGGFLLCGIAATIIIAAVVHPQPGPIARAFSFTPLVGLGLISYGVYLYHWPIDVALDSKEMGFSGWPLVIFQIAVTLGISIASYRFVEQPIRHGAWSAVEWRRFVPATALVLVVVMFAVTANGLPSTVPGLRHPTLAAEVAYANAPPGAERVMVVGDSVAYFLGKAMKQVKRDPPIAVFSAGVQGCGFPPPMKRARYHSANGQHLDKKTFACDPLWEGRAVKKFKPAVVFWLTGNPADSVLYNGQWIDTCSTAYATLYENSLRQAFKVMGWPKTKIVMTTEPYPRYLFAEEDKPTDCENNYRRVVASAMHVQLIDLMGYICPGGQCVEKLHGVTLRKDGEHFENAGGRLVASWLLDQVK